MEIHYQDSNSLTSTHTNPIFVIEVDPDSYDTFINTVDPNIRSTIPLAQVVNSKYPLIIRTGSHTGTREMASNLDFENTFGEGKGVDDIIKFILSHGKLHRIDSYQKDKTRFSNAL